MTVRDSITRTGARTPGAEDYPTSMAAHGRASHPTQCGITEVASMCARGRHKPNISRCMPGAGLSRPCAGRCCPTCQPSSRIGENPPYGMIGRVEETSASFEARSAPRLYPSLGALQALNDAGVLKHVDYLSTVAGGGYIGCCLSACLESTKGHFPFESPRPLEDETPPIQHIRDYSNYLFPNGASDFLHNASIYARGLIANFILVMPFLLLFAALTIASNPKLGEPKIFGIEIPSIFLSFGKFVVTGHLALILFGLTVFWALFRSTRSRNRPEIPSPMNTVVGAMVLALLFSAFVELQPYLIFRKIQHGSVLDIADLAESIKWLSVTLGPLAAVVAIFKAPIETHLKSTMESASWRLLIAHYAMRLGILVAALIVPFLLWMVYLNLSLWGICPVDEISKCGPPDWVSAPAGFLFGGLPQELSIVALYVA